MGSSRLVNNNRGATVSSVKAFREQGVPNFREPGFSNVKKSRDVNDEMGDTTGAFSGSLTYAGITKASSFPAGFSRKGSTASGMSRKSSVVNEEYALDDEQVQFLEAICSSSSPDEKQKLAASVPESHLEHYFARVENLIHSFEEYNSYLLNKQSEHFVAFAQEVRDEIVQSPLAKADRIVKYLESTSFGHELKDMELLEKLAHGMDYLEDLVEDSRVLVTIQTALASACDRLLTYDELPEDWQENPYVTAGYRFSRSLGECIKSIFKLHNETLNIWSHLLGIIMFLSLAYWHLPTTISWQKGTWIDRAPMLIFVAAALKCLLCSVTWHSCSSICKLHVKRRVACVDYTGITICISASILTTEYNVLKCHPLAQSFYMFITLVCGGIGIMLNWHPMFDTTGARPMRALFFCCFAVFGGLCGIHAAFYRGVSETLAFYAPVIKSLMCYLTGVLFYATLFPEKYFKRFTWGMSHCIWHCFVLTGIYYHYQAMIEMFTKTVFEVCPA